MGELQTRSEKFDGLKSDMSHAVPFYAIGYFHVTPEEMEEKLYQTEQGDVGCSVKLAMIVIVSKTATS